MSLLDDYEDLCQAQDVSIFKGVLDEVLRPILIQLEERYFGLNHKLDELQIQIMNMETRINDEMTDDYEVHNTKLHNMWTEVLKLQSDMETIKLNLKK